MSEDERDKRFLSGEEIAKVLTGLASIGKTRISLEEESDYDSRDEEG